MIKKEISCFNLSDICRSGQIFRMYETEKGLFDVFSADRHLRLAQEGQLITFYCTENEYTSYWKRYFDLDRDYSTLGTDLFLQNSTLGTDLAPGTRLNSEPGTQSPEQPCDSFLANARSACIGIRILNQDIWEMMITFIISQQKQIPSIRKCVEALCARFGERRQDEFLSWYTFPTPESIAAAGPDGLKDLSLGYRDRYIYETAVKYLVSGLPDAVVEAMDYNEAKKYFLSYTGIGEKVANCILLFGAGFVDAFPIDTHIMDILYREYYMKQPMEEEKRLPKEKMTRADYEALIDKYFGRYKGYRGIVQQWIFAYEIN